MEQLIEHPHVIHELNHSIPFNRPFIVGNELDYIAQAVYGGQLAGGGRFNQLCNEWMEREFNAQKVMITHTCTAALEICAILADIGPEDEVLTPSYSFVSTTNAFALRGATIKFVDIRPDTLNMDESLVEAAITEKTKAIVPVHYGGVGCEMSVIMEVAEKYDLIVIEDAAQGVNATYMGQYLGTIGHLGAYSFHETKNFISGEGGALVINDAKFSERAEIICEKGTDRTKFFRGEVDKYSWVDIGSSYLPSELTAAFLYAQLENADQITRKRWSIFNTYMELLSPLKDMGLIGVPSAPAECRHNAHMFYLILQDTKTRDNLLSYLKSVDISSVFHYVPLHLSPMGRSLGYKPGDLPITEDLSSRLVRLPCYYDLTRFEQERIVREIMNFLC